MFEDMNNIRKKEIFHLALLTHKSEIEIQKILNVLLFIIFLNYTEGKSTYIPNIGNFKFIHKGDKIAKEQGKTKKKAIVDVEFEVDDNLAKLIGQFSDKSEGEIEKYLKNKIREVLEFKLDE